MDLCAQTFFLEQHPVCIMKLLKLEVTFIDVLYFEQVIRTNLFSLIGWCITKWRRGSLRGCKASYYRCFPNILSVIYLTICVVCISLPSLHILKAVLINIALVGYENVMMTAACKSLRWHCALLSPAS